MRRLHLCALLLTLLLCATLSLVALPKHHQASTSQPGDFDYYLLSVSWAPNYCEDHPSHSGECRPGAGKAFVLHGLWPQSETGRYLQNCADAPPVASDIVNRMLNYMPTASLVQHEWQTHGTCSGLSAQDYFDKVEQAFRNLQIPQAYQQLPQQQKVGVQALEQAFASANSTTAGAFRVSCHIGELVNVEACLSKDLQFQSCKGTGVRQCNTSQVQMLPTTY